ncbi:hypothetical protein ACHAWF_017111 [Thalassiosira exigua]
MTNMNAYRTYHTVDLNELTALKLDEDELNEYRSQKNIVVSLPINENGDCADFRPFDCKSVYHQPKTAEREEAWYHLHPELVHKGRVVICHQCLYSVLNDAKPLRSISSGVDFGAFFRIKSIGNDIMEAPSLREHQIIAKVRHYYNIIKLETNARQLKEHQQSAIKGSTILFDHDGPDVAAKLLCTEDMNRNMKLHFVGSKGEFDSLYKKVMRTRSADVFGRSYVIYQWLKVLSYTNPIYEGIELETFPRFKKRLQNANDVLLQKAMDTFSEETVKRNETMKDDVAGIHASTNIYMQNTSEETYNDGSFGMRYCCLTTPDKTANEATTDSTQAYFTEAAKFLNIDVTQENEEYNQAKSYRSEYPVNEFERGDYGLVAAFPHVFMLGTAYKKAIGNINEEDCRHLLMQFTAVPSSCAHLVFFLFDVKRRHQNISGMAAKVRNDRLAFQKFVEEFQSDAFQEKLRWSVKHPDSKDGRYVKNKLMPVLTTAGKHTTFGALERNSAVGELLAMIRRFGSQFCFLTCSFDDVNNPQVFRLTFRQINNEEFPSNVDSDILNKMKKGKPFAVGDIKIPTTWSAMAKAAVGNPVAVGFMYQRLLYNILTILIGIKPASSCGTNNRTTRSRRFDEASRNQSDGGVMGNVDAGVIVTEASGRGGEHTHGLYWGGIATSILQNSVKIDDICQKVSETLDTMYCAELPRSYHVKDLIEKELVYHTSTSNVYEKLDRRGRCAVVPPDPMTEQEAFKDHTRTTVCYNGIHGHSSIRHGTCHQPPRGIEGCRLNKPSNLAESTRPVQLKDVTPETEEKISNIEFEVIYDRDEMETREEAIENLHDKDRLTPMKERYADPRLIVWELKRPQLEKLPSCEEDSTKKWFLDQLEAALTDQSNEKDDSFENSVPDLKSRKESFTVSEEEHESDDVDDESSNSSQIHTEEENEPSSPEVVVEDVPLKEDEELIDIEEERESCSPEIVVEDVPLEEDEELCELFDPKNNMSPDVHEPCMYEMKWSWPMDSYLPYSRFNVIRTPHDGNCLYNSCLIGIHDERNTTPGELRKELNAYLMNHPEDEFGPGLPLMNMIRENVLNNQVNEYSKNHPKVDFSNPTEMEKIREGVKYVLAQLVDLEVLKRYTEIMSDATPNQCEYATLVELHAFSRRKKVNIVVYNESPFKHDGPSHTYKQEAILHYADSAPTIALLWVDRIHYNVLMPVTDSSDFGLSDTNLSRSSKKAKWSSNMEGKCSDAKTESDDFVPSDPDLSPPFKKVKWSSSTKRKCSNRKTGKNDLKPFDSDLSSPSKKIKWSLSAKEKSSDTTTRNNSNKKDPTFMSQREIRRLMTYLAGMEVSDLRRLYEKVSSKLAKRNGYVVDFNYLLTSILGTNTNSLLLGGTEQSKGATFYVGPYTTKNKTNLNESLDVVLEATEHAREYPSVAEDKETDKRFVQYVMTRILNKLNSLQEISDTQAASALLGLNVSLCSEIFVTYNAESFIKFALDERKRVLKENDSSVEDSDYSDGVSSQRSFSDDDSFIVWNDSKDNLEALNENELEEELEALKEVKVLVADATKEIDYNEYEPVRYYDSQYGSCKVYQVDEDTIYEPIANPLLYRYRGNKLKGLNRLEYFCTVRTIKDPSEKERKENPSKCQKRPNNHQYRFSPGLLIHANHHQIMRTKSCTPKLFANPPRHPGRLPLCCDECNKKVCNEKGQDLEKNHGTTNKNDIGVQNHHTCKKCNRVEAEWNKKADIFACYYLTMFRPETELCDELGDKVYDYDWKAFEEFVQELQKNDGTNKQLAINRFRLDQMARMMQSLKMNNRSKKILFHYRGLSRDIWSKKEQEEGRQAYQQRGGKTKYREDELGNELDPILQAKQLSSVVERNVMAQATFTSQILNSLDRVTPDIDMNDEKRSNGKENESSSSVIPPQYPILTPTFDANIASNSLEKPDAISSQTDSTESNSRFQPSNDDSETIREKLAYLLHGQEISEDKELPLRIMYRHFLNVLDGTAAEKPVPFLVVTGAPGTGIDVLGCEITRSNSMQRDVRWKSSRVIGRFRPATPNRALLVKLHVQHRFAQDQKHVELLEKMKRGFRITPNDLSLYQTLETEDMTSDNFLFATTIVSNNHERHEINARQAQLWAKHYRTHVIRWKRNVISWKGKPPTERQVSEAEKETCFWEYFVPMATGYLTHNLNTERELANGTEICLHSLSFETEEEIDFLRQMQETTAFGGIIDLPNPPKAINVELYPDSELDGRIRKINESIRGRGGSVRFRPCKAMMQNHFPIELGFSVTVEKAQGRTIRKVIASISEHPVPILKFRWEQLYVILSRDFRKCQKETRTEAKYNSPSFTSALASDTSVHKTSQRTEYIAISSFTMTKSSTKSNKDGGTPTRKHKLKASFASSPCRGSGKNRKGIVTARTRCAFVKNFYPMNTNSNTSCFINNLIELFNGDPDHWSGEWNIHGWFDRRDVNATEPNKIMKAKPGEASGYGWHGGISLDADPEHTPEWFGRHIARSFTDQSGYHSRYGPTEYFYLRDATTNPPQPVNHFFIDSDTVKILKHVYNDHDITKNDILEDEEVLSEFFGSVEEGQRIIGEVTDEEWRDML